jgi:hypothetical protein
MSYGKIMAQQEDGLIHFHAPGKKFSARKSLRLGRRVALQDQSKKAPTGAKPKKFTKNKSYFSDASAVIVGKTKWRGETADVCLPLAHGTHTLSLAYEGTSGKAELRVFLPLRSSISSSLRQGEVHF